MDADIRVIQRWAGAPVDGAFGPVTARRAADKIRRLDAEIVSPPFDRAALYIPGTITERIMVEIIEHEGIVREAYRDSVGVWTWGVGVTNASGHRVARYKDTPSTIKRCLEVYEWLLRKKYLPGVLDAFAGFPLSEAQLGAALSFHWNTGEIGKAFWVKEFKAGRADNARVQFMNYSRPREIIGRRQAERNLFFDGTWTSDGIVTVYDEVSKPSYIPRWSSARQMDIRPLLAEVIAGAGE